LDYKHALAQRGIFTLSTFFIGDEDNRYCTIVEFEGGKLEEARAREKSKGECSVEGIAG